MPLPAIEELWNYADPEDSEQQFRAILPDALAADDDAYLIELQSQIACALCLQRRYDAAHTMLDEAEALLTESMLRPRIRCLLERGRIWRDQEESPRALTLFMGAWKTADRINDRLLAADALHMIAYTTEAQESVFWHERAIEYCNNSEGKRFRRWLSTLYMNLATKHETMEEYHKGLAAVEKARAVSEDLGWTERVQPAECFLARLHRLNGNVSRAMTYLERILDSEDPRGYFFEEHAECLLLNGEEEQAREQFRRAYELLSVDPWFPPDETERLQRIKQLAGL